MVVLSVGCRQEELLRRRILTGPGCLGPGCFRDALVISVQNRYLERVPMVARARPVSKRFAVLAAAFTLVVGGAAMSRAAVLPTLYVNYVGTNCTFTLTNDSNTSVTTLEPGTYQLMLQADDFQSCASGLPDFRLTGPGVSVETPIDAGNGSAANFQINLQPSSTYVAQDSSQPLSRITFVTLASGAPAAPTIQGGGGGGSTVTTSSGGGSGKSAIGTSTGATGDPLRGALLGLVNATGKLSLTEKGKAVASLKSGRYTLTVTDESSRSGFTIQQSTKSPSTVTGVAFVGKKTETLDFKPGQWLFYPSVVGSKSYFIVSA